MLDAAADEASAAIAVFSAHGQGFQAQLKRHHHPGARTLPFGRLKRGIPLIAEIYPWEADERAALERLADTRNG